MTGRAESETRRVGLVTASTLALERLLQLPPGHSITSAHWHESEQQVVFAIQGPTMPVVRAGDVIPRVRPLVRERPFQSLRVEWPAVTSSET